MPSFQPQQSQTSSPSYPSQSSWLEGSTASAYPAYQPSRAFSGLNDPLSATARANHYRGAPGDRRLQTEVSRGSHWFPSTAREFADPDREGGKTTGGASTISLEARLQSAAQTYWEHSDSNVPSPQPSPQALGHASSAFGSTAPGFGAPSGTRPSLALESLAAEAALEVALDQKRKQLHGMLGSPVGGDSAPLAARRGVEIFTKGPVASKGDGYREEGTYGEAKAENEEGADSRGSDAFERKRVGESDATSVAGLPVDGALSVTEAGQGEADANVAGVSQGRPALASTSGVPPVETENGYTSERVVDPDSIERRLSRIGEMLDISSLPISSRAAAQRQNQRSSKTDSYWGRTILPASLTSGLEGVGRGKSVATESNTQAPAKANVERGPGEQVVRSSVTSAATLVVSENFVEGVLRDAGKAVPVASSGNEEFFSVPPTPSQSGPPLAALKRTSLEGRAETAPNMERVATSGSANQLITEEDQSERRDPILDVSTQAQKRTEVVAVPAEPEREPRADRGDAEGVETRKPAAPRAEGLRTVADGASLWAPNPRPRRKSDSGLVLPQTLWTANPTGPLVRGNGLQAQPAGKEDDLPARIIAKMEPGEETRTTGQRPGLITELEGEDLDYSSETAGQRTGSAKKAASKSRKQAVQVHSPPYRRSVKSPGGSNRRSRAKPIQLMSALKHLSSGRGKAPGTEPLTVVLPEEPVTPEFATDGGAGRPKQTTVRNLQKRFDSVAGPVRRGSLDDMVSIELSGEVETDSPEGALSSRDGESQLATTGAETINSSGPIGASTGVSTGLIEQEERGRGVSPEWSMGPLEAVPASPLKPSRGSVDARSGGNGSAVGLSGEGKEVRDVGRQLAEEREARRAAESRAQAAEENAKVMASSLAAAQAERAAVESQLEEEYNRKATQQSALKNWADVERVQKERQVRQLTSERDELRAQASIMEALVEEGRHFAAEVHRRRAQVQEREDEIQGLKQRVRQLEAGLAKARDESARAKAAAESFKKQNVELASENEGVKKELVRLEGRVREARSVGPLARIDEEGERPAGSAGVEESGTTEDESAGSSEEKGKETVAGKTGDCSGGVGVEGSASDLPQTELAALKETVHVAVREILASGVVDELDSPSEAADGRRFGGFGKMWGGKGRSDADGLRERNAKLARVLKSTLETLEGGTVAGADVRQSSLGKESESQVVESREGLTGALKELSGKPDALQREREGKQTTSEGAQREPEGGSVEASDVGVQTEAAASEESPEVAALREHLRKLEEEAEEQVKLLTWQGEKLAALEKEGEAAGALQGKKMEAGTQAMTTESATREAEQTGKAGTERASTETRGLQKEGQTGSELVRDAPERGGAEQAKKPPLGPFSPALSQLGLLGVTPTREAWELDESDNSFLNQYANPIFEREAEVREVEEARAQVDELVKEKVRLETELAAALRAVSESDSRLRLTQRNLEGLRGELETDLDTPGGSVATDRAVAGSDMGGGNTPIFGSAAETPETDAALAGLTTRVAELEMQNAALMLKLAEAKKAEGNLTRVGNWANESRRLEEELQTVVGRWEAEAQRLAALEAEGRERERRLREEEARGYAAQRELENAQRQVRKAEAAATEAQQAALTARRRLDDKESEVTALAEAASELRRICTEQEDVIEALRQENDDVMEGLKREQDDVMAELRRGHEAALEAERREKDRLAQEVGRLLGGRKPGATSPTALTPGDLLGQAELRRSLAAAEARVAELEALLEEAKKKDGLLGLVQKAHQTIRKDMGDADKALGEMRARYKEMEARLAASLQEARDKESAARADADKLAQEAKTFRSDVTALKASVEEKERALEEAHKRAEALKQRAESAETEAAGFRQRKVSADERNAAALVDARAVREQAQMHERAAREAARRIEVAERKAEESAQAIADLQRGLSTSLEEASAARGRADALQATLAERERALKALGDELQAARDTWQARDASDAGAERERAELRRALGDHKAQVKELVAINEELLAFGQGKEREVESLQKRIRQLQTRDAGAHGIVEGLEAQIAGLQEEARAQGIRYEALAKKLTATEAEVRRQEARVGEAVAESEERLAEVRRELARVTKEKEGLREMLQSQGADLEEARGALNEVECAEASALSQLAEFKERLVERDRRVSELVEKVKVLKEEVRTMVDELDTCRKQVDAAREEAQRQERETAVLRNRAAQLEEDVMEREGQISILRGSLNHDTDFTLDTPRKW
ncbi:hypothetical protein KFL_000500410 [Klebsormidium nitens]|uniref:Uncharacterized protein n=1 Tax=Klebsormidium nitens TaxID=105231 RepID=A0A1Y1HWR4_KLENI|nr:hypothetical protein KFL_000500410 [Klebsormidium nitens]|eukprot:GAQ80288.1 hypothetical protein KFL_000500410 [Klebsormidium nitens]